jgi:hypothetical protein
MPGPSSFSPPSCTQRHHRKARTPPRATLSFDQEAERFTMELSSKESVSTQDKSLAESKEEEEEEEAISLTIQKVAEISAATHNPPDEGEDDEPTDLLSFPSRKPSFRRKGSVTRSSSSSGAGIGLMRSGLDGVTPAPLSRSFSSHQGDPRMGGARVTRNRSMRSRVAPGRSVSTESLRGFRRDLVQNQSIATGRDMFDRKDRAVRRTRSGDDLSIASDVDSCFTTDSINLRKCQLIADPIEGMYNDLDSCADHESVYGTMSYDCDFDGYSEYAAEEYRTYQKSDASVDDYSFCTLDSSRVNRMQVHPVLGDDVSFLRSNSFSTLASGDGADLNDISDDEEEIVDENPSEREDDQEEDRKQDPAEKSETSEV